MEAKKMQPMSIQEFNGLETEDQLVYELIDGLVMMSPRPSTYHQKIMSELHFKLRGFLQGAACHVLTETEVELDDHVLVPDLFVYCEHERLGEQRYKGAPRLVIEILSPSTAFNDMNLKLKLYEKYGVEEYWIVAPTTKTLTRYHFGEELAEVFGYTDTIESIALQGMVLPLSEVFV